MNETVQGYLPTGQTTCHDGSGTVAPCAGSGQDGAFRRGIPWPEPRFEVRGRNRPRPAHGTCLAAPHEPHAGGSDLVSALSRMVGSGKSCVAMKQHRSYGGHGGASVRVSCGRRCGSRLGTEFKDEQMTEINKRRRLLVIATSALGVAGIGFMAAPFIASMLPSERAKAIGGPVNVDISKLEPGQMLMVEWRGKPVWIVSRASPILARLEGNAPLLVDPDSQVATQQPPYAKNLYRSIKPAVLVLVGICTHLGCVPSQRFAVGEESGLGGDWPGGFFCPCHGSKFDLAGRVFKNVPAPTNLVVPPHYYAAKNRIVIGVDTPGPEHG